MYFVSYTTNKFELPQYGWNVWEVNKLPVRGNGPHGYKIVDIIIGGKKKPDAKAISVVDTNQHIVNNKREVFERIFNK